MVRRIIEEFRIGLRRGLDDYKGINGDYIGEQLHWDYQQPGFLSLARLPRQVL